MALIMIRCSVLFFFLCQIMSSQTNNVFSYSYLARTSLCLADLFRNLVVKIF